MARNPRIDLTGAGRAIGEARYEVGRDEAPLAQSGEEEKRRVYRPRPSPECARPAIRHEYRLIEDATAGYFPQPKAVTLAETEKART